MRLTKKTKNLPTFLMNQAPIVRQKIADQLRTLARNKEYFDNRNVRPREVYKINFVDSKHSEEHGGTIITGMVKNPQTDFIMNFSQLTKIRYLSKKIPQIDFALPTMTLYAIQTGQSVPFTEISLIWPYERTGKRISSIFTTVEILENSGILSVQDSKIVEVDRRTFDNKVFFNAYKPISLKQYGATFRMDV